MLVELDVNVQEALAGIVHNVLLIVNFARVSSISFSFWSLECELVIFLLIYVKPACFGQILLSRAVVPYLDVCLGHV